MNHKEAIDIIKKEFKGFDNEEFNNTQIEETENYIYITSHVKPLGYTSYLHRYFIISIYKHLFNKVIYSDTNVIDNTFFKGTEEAKERTKNYLNHLLSKV